MKTVYAILLLLAGCSGQSSEEAENAARAAEEAALQAELQRATAASADPARLEALAARALPAALPGATDLLYRNLRAGTGGAVCGEVAAGGGGFRPFVVTSDGAAVVASGPAIAFEDPGDSVADAWIRWCATAEELRKLAPVLQRVAPPPLPADLTAGQAGTLPPPGALPVPEPVVPAPDPKRGSAAPARPAEIDSFFNSVDRGTR